MVNQRMATRVCPECKAVYVVAAGQAASPARCSKCAAKPSAKAMTKVQPQRATAATAPGKAKTSPPPSPVETLDAADTFVGEPAAFMQAASKKPDAPIGTPKAL